MRLESTYLVRTLQLMRWSWLNIECERRGLTAKETRCGTGYLYEGGEIRKTETALSHEGSTEAPGAHSRPFEPHFRMQAVSKPLLLIFKDLLGQF
jgi:hypothetical protein